MKKIITFLAGTLVACAAYAESPGMTEFNITVQTNGEAVVSNSPKEDAPISGWLDSVIVDVSGTVVSNQFVILTLAAQGTGASRTLFERSDVTADATYPLRDLVTDTGGDDISNEPAKHVLVGDKLRLQFYQDTGAVATGINARVFCIFSNDP